MVGKIGYTLNLLIFKYLTSDNKKTTKSQHINSQLSNIHVAPVTDDHDSCKTCKNRHTPSLEHLVVHAFTMNRCYLNTILSRKYCSHLRFHIWRYRLPGASSFSLYSQHRRMRNNQVLQKTFYLCRYSTLTLISSPRLRWTPSPAGHQSQI